MLQPIVFSHGWPLSADDWDAQMPFFQKHGYRVIAHDRRGHDMDHYDGASRFAKAVIISAVPPLMVKTANNPGGLAAFVLMINKEANVFLPFAV